MILADKIIYLRKKHNMTQEELAEMVDVSRQSISKWEGALSIPDINKIIILSDVFGVSTDFLLNDELDINSLDIKNSQPDNFIVKIEFARDYLSFKKKYATSIALSVMMFILSGIIVILSNNSYFIGLFGENLALTIALSVGLVLVVIGVGTIIMANQKLESFQYIEDNEFDLEYGALGIIEKIKNHYRPTYYKKMVTGIGLCIISILPLFINLAFENHNQLDFIQNISVVIFLVILATGIFLLTEVSIYWPALNHLTKTNEERLQEKLDEKKENKISSIYWPLVTAIYIGYSLITNNWHISWIIWPVAGILYPAIHNIFDM